MQLDGQGWLYKDGAKNLFSKAKNTSSSAAISENIAGRILPLLAHSIASWRQAEISLIPVEYLSNLSTATLLK